MRKNQYEEALFRCEDDRFELVSTTLLAYAASANAVWLHSTCSAHTCASLGLPAQVTHWTVAALSLRNKHHCVADPAGYVHRDQQLNLEQVAATA